MKKLLLLYPQQNAKTSRFCKITHRRNFELASSDMRKFHFPFPLSTRVECSCLVNYTCPIDKRRTHTQRVRTTSFNSQGGRLRMTSIYKETQLPRKSRIIFHAKIFVDVLWEFALNGGTSFAKENLSISQSSPPPQPATEQNCRN